MISILNTSKPLKTLSTSNKNCMVISKNKGIHH